MTIIRSGVVRIEQNNNVSFLLDLRQLCRSAAGIGVCFLIGQNIYSMRSCTEVEGGTAMLASKHFSANSMQVASTVRWLQAITVE